MPDSVMVSNCFRSSQIYDNPDEYWQQRLSSDFSLTGVGHISLGETYNKFIYRARLETLERVMLHLKIALGPTTSMLDLGCGNGFYTEMAAQSGVVDYTGVDISEKSVVELSRKYSKYRFRQTDVSSSEWLLEEKFDVILAADVLFHIAEDSRFDNAIKNISTCLKRGGSVIISDLFQVEGGSVRPAPHVCFRSLPTYDRIFKQYHLRRVHVEPIFFILHPPVCVEGTSLLLKTYEKLWRYGLLRIAKWDIFDRSLPRWFFKLDERFLIRRATLATPNLKWLIGMKANNGSLIP
ncbi:MAG: class I SAM-dependent methyltransferase [Candidatus Hodarchaeota archaeon]